MRTLSGAWVLALLLAGGKASPLAAQDGIEPSRLQVLLAAGPGDAGRAALEQRLITELRLLLDHFEVVATPLADRGFGAMAADEQVVEAVSAAERAGAKATIWIDSSDGRTLELRYLERGSGEILTRSVRLDAASNPEAILATATWELLTTGRIADGVADEAAEYEERSNEERPPARAAAGRPSDGASAANEALIAWGGIVAFESGGGIGTGTPSALVGGGAALLLEVAGCLLLSAGVSALSEADIHRDGEMRLAARVAPRLEIGPVWRPGVLLLWPLVRFSVPWSRYGVALGDGNRFSEWYPNGRFDLGLIAALALPGPLRLFAGGGAGINLIEDRFDLVSGREVRGTSLFEWGATLGVMMAR